MLFQAVNLIRTELNSFGLSSELGNIGELITSGGINGNTNANIIISLINIEENRISRDPRNYQQNGNIALAKNPAVHLYLTLLFTATRSEAAYGPALQSVQRVIQFFQQKALFDHSNTAGMDPGIEKLILEMVTVGLEGLNQLWAILGSRYQPSVIYKMRMVTIDSVTEQEVGLVREIETKFFAE
jgi:hypothetical protein